MSASDDETREELAAMYPDVIRVAAGIMSRDELWKTADDVAEAAIRIVRACRAACFGGDA